MYLFPVTGTVTYRLFSISFFLSGTAYTDFLITKDDFDGNGNPICEVNTAPGMQKDIMDNGFYYFTNVERTTGK